jgi:rhamnose utilization protein RhaD (predicted bifunctional aldolase and dehydrogenase)
VKPLQSLRTLSAHIGADPWLVQAAGGNTSLKENGVMWIKASGTWLKDADTKDIFVPLDYRKLATALNDDDPDCESCLKFVRTDLNPAGLRPSIETSVHGLMHHAVVLHVHCVNTIALAIQENAETLFAEKLVGENWSFISYARPGLNLSRAIRQNIKPNCNILVLGNHGLVVAAETVAAAEKLLRSVVKKLSLHARTTHNPDIVKLHKIAAGTDYAPAVLPETHALAYDDFALSEGAENVFYPDHVVFLGRKIPRDFSSNAPAVVVPQQGVFIHKSCKPAVEPMVRCVSDVFRRIDTATKLRALNEKQIDELLNWDAEKYRQTMLSN